MDDRAEQALRFVLGGLEGLRGVERLFFSGDSATLLQGCFDVCQINA